MTAVLGDLLGRLADPPRAAPFEAERLYLVDQLVSAGDGPPAQVWQEAFEAGVERVVAEVAAAGDRRLVEAARHSRMPVRRFVSQRPDAEYQDQLRHRLLATAIPLERLEGANTSADVTRRRAMALESAWDEVVVLAAAELRQWSRTADQIVAWRRPTRPLWIATVVLLLLTLVAALWLGGLLQPPTWFRPVADGFWSLPWWG